MNRQKPLYTTLLYGFLCLAMSNAWSDTGNAEERARDKAMAEAEEQQLLDERQEMLAEAEVARAEAMRALEQAQEALATDRANQTEEMILVQEELSRAHRELREASREIALAHRDISGRNHSIKKIEMINLGDKPVIGILLGKSSEEGLELIGVSPDGPAERAGLQQGDVVTSIRGVDLTGLQDKGARDTLIDVMSDVSAGEELAISVIRNGEPWNYNVTAEQREPRSWQSMVRLPEGAPGEPGAPGAPRVHVERIVVPDIDQEALAIQIKEITDHADQLQYMFISRNGETVEFDHDFDIDIDPEQFSGIGKHAFITANAWFGTPATAGLELVSVNPELGRYFKAEKGVLVVKAREDNAYELQAGDVIGAIDDREVNSPADLLRVLRDAEPGSSIELNIIRDRRNKTLNAVIPENRLGYVLPGQTKRHIYELTIESSD